jgi:lipid kinase YegS
VRVTWEGGDSQRLAQEAVLQGVSTVVAGGGDGSINEVALGIVTAPDHPTPHPTLGIVPLGTANDFARSAGIPLDLLEALRLAVETPAYPVDVGRVDDRLFVNVATGGFGTKITVETPEETKKILGGAAYFLTGVKQFGTVRASNARFIGPDFEWEGPFMVLALGNGRQAGGGHVLCPDAVIDDGLLELRVLPDVPQGKVAETLGSLLKEGIEAIERMVVTAKLEWVRIEADETLYINLDGEPISGTEFEFRIIPRALNLHLPESSPLLTKAG